MNSFSMFNLWAGEGGEFGTRDTAQGFPFLSPDAVSSLSDLVCTLIGDMHDTIGVSVQQFIQLLEADALTSLGGAINGAGDGIATSRRQFLEDTADIVAHVPCNMRTQLEGFDGVGDCRTINAA